METVPISVGFILFVFFQIFSCIAAATPANLAPLLTPSAQIQEADTATKQAWLQVKHLQKQAYLRLRSTREAAVDKQNKADAARKEADRAWAGNVHLAVLNQTIGEARRHQEMAVAAWAAVETMRQEEKIAISQQTLVAQKLQKRGNRLRRAWIREQSPRFETLVATREKEAKAIQSYFQSRVNTTMDEAIAAWKLVETIQHQVTTHQQEIQQQERLLKAQYEAAKKRVQDAQAQIGNAWNDQSASLNEMVQEMNRPQWEQQRAQRAQTLATALQTRNKKRLEAVIAQEKKLKQKAQQTMSIALDLQKQARIAVAVAKARVRQARVWTKMLRTQATSLPTDPAKTTSR